MRIIAGQWRGRAIVAPKGGGTTRPTSDRAREALFSILTPRLEGAAVLDLFAGSGAMGLEALSRGAARALLCDSDRKACEAIRRNIEALDAGEIARVEEGDALKLLNRLTWSGERFSLIFLDPPYKAGLLAGALEAIAGHGVLERGGLIIAESSAAAPPGEIAGLAVADRRRYGIAAFTMYAREADA